MSKGYVYVLTNPAMPGLHKIGMTKNCPYARAKDLSAGTGVPLPFEVHCAVFSPNCAELEATMHEDFGEFRLNGSREFFKVDVDGITTSLQLRLEQQVDAYVGEYMPGHRVTTRLENARRDQTMDNLIELAGDMGVDPNDLVDAFLGMTASEVRPFFERSQALALISHRLEVAA